MKCRNLVPTYFIFTVMLRFPLLEDGVWMFVLLLLRLHVLLRYKFDKPFLPQFLDGCTLKLGLTSPAKIVYMADGSTVETVESSK